MIIFQCNAIYCSLALLQTSSSSHPIFLVESTLSLESLQLGSTSTSAAVSLEQSWEKERVNLRVGFEAKNLVQGGSLPAWRPESRPAQQEFRSWGSKAGPQLQDQGQSCPIFHQKTSSSLLSTPWPFPIPHNGIRSILSFSLPYSHIAQAHTQKP